MCVSERLEIAPESGLATDPNSHSRSTLAPTIRPEFLIVQSQGFKLAGLGFQTRHYTRLGREREQGRPIDLVMRLEG